MKINFNLFFLLTFFIFSNCFSQVLEWESVMAGYNEETGNSIALDNSGNVIITGSFEGLVQIPGAGYSSAGSHDVFIQKLSPTGNILWTKRFGGINQDDGHSVVTDDVGNIYLAGTFLGTVNFGLGNLSSTISENNFFLLKLSQTGTIIWQKTITGTIYDRPKLAIDNANNLYLSGAFVGTRNFDAFSLNAYNGRAFVAKINTSTSNIIWVTQYGSGSTLNGTTVTVNNTVSHIAVDSNQNLFITGSFRGHGRFGNQNILIPSSNLIYAYVAKLNSQGIFEWTKTYTDTVQGTAIVIDSNNNIYTAGNYTGTANINNTSYTSVLNKYSIFIQKLDANGQVQWVKNYNTNLETHSYAQPQLAVSSNSTLFLKCIFSNIITFEGISFNEIIGSNTNIIKNQLFALYNSNGNNLWVNQYENPKDYTTFGTLVDRTNNIATTNDAMYFTNGNSKFNDISYSLESGANIFVAKLVFPPLNSETFDKEIGVVASPNPTSGVVKLSLNKLYSNIEIKVYNLLGQMINILKYNSIDSIFVNLPDEKGVFILDINLDGSRIKKIIIKK